MTYSKLMLFGETVKAFPLRWGENDGHPLSAATLVLHRGLPGPVFLYQGAPGEPGPEALANATGQEKGHKHCKEEKNEAIIS